MAWGFGTKASVATVLSTQIYVCTFFDKMYLHLNWDHVLVPKGSIRVTSHDGHGISDKLSATWLFAQQLSRANDKETIKVPKYYYYCVRNHKATGRVNSPNTTNAVSFSMSWSQDIHDVLVPKWWPANVFNSLRPSDAIWRPRSGSTLAPSHYLNQCWLIISEVQWHSY